MACMHERILLVGELEYWIVARILLVSLDARPDCELPLLELVVTLLNELFETVALNMIVEPLTPFL